MSKCRGGGSLKYRKDNRTIKQFANDIQKYTKIEKLAAKLLKADLEARKCDVKVVDNGVDNTGKVIKEGGVHARPDYVFIINGIPKLFEIKVHTDRVPFMTFKQDNVDKYMRDGGSLVIVRESCWWVFDQKALEYIAARYKAQRRGCMGNKPTYRLFQSDLTDMREQNLVKVHKWTKEAEAIITKGKTKLFGE
jgi:hypothetical protein